MSAALAITVALLFPQQADRTPSSSNDTPVQVAPVPVTGTASSNAATSRDDQIVCRREHVLGSNRPQRVCAPRREWDRARDNAQDAARNANSRETPNALPVMR